MSLTLSKPSNFIYPQEQRWAFLPPYFVCKNLYWIKFWEGHNIYHNAPSVNFWWDYLLFDHNYEVMCQFQLIGTLNITNSTATFSQELKMVNEAFQFVARWSRDTAQSNSIFSKSFWKILNQVFLIKIATNLIKMRQSGKLQIFGMFLPSFNLTHQITFLQQILCQNV